MMGITTRTVPDETTTPFRGAHGTHGSAHRKRLPAALGLGLAGALALTGASPAAAVSDAESGGTGFDGPTQTHSTEGDHFQWTLPASWTVSEELVGPDTTDEYGVENERAVFQNHDEKALFTADTGQGPTDNDGAKPEVVEVLEAEKLEGVPEDASTGGEVYYRAAILEDTGQLGDQGFFEGEDHRLAVQVVNVPEGTDPASTEDYWDAWSYVLPAAEGFDQGTGAMLQGHITESDAEALTGDEGEDALRAVVETGQYDELRLVATSMEVTAP